MPRKKPNRTTSGRLFQHPRTAVQQEKEASIARSKGGLPPYQPRKSTQGCKTSSHRSSRGFRRLRRRNPRSYMRWRRSSRPAGVRGCSKCGGNLPWTTRPTSLAVDDSGIQLGHQRYPRAETAKRNKTNFESHRLAFDVHRIGREALTRHGSLCMRQRPANAP